MNIFNSRRETLDELCARFREIPKSIIIKTDVVNRGIKLNFDIIQIKKNYFYNYFNLSDGTNILATYVKESPYEINKDEDKYSLLYEGEFITDIYFLKVPKYVKELARGDVNVPFSQRSETCAYLSPITACSYFFNKEACDFCGFNQLWESYIKGKGPMIPDPEIYVEIINKGIQEVGLTHIKLTGGALYDLKQEAKIYAKLADAISKKTNIKEIHAYPQAFEKDDVQRLYDSGVTQVCFDIEIWDEKLWDVVLLGKAKTVGRKEWLKRMQDAVNIYGKWNVSTNIVAGYELAYEAGFSSLEEGIKSNIEGFEWFVDNGIEPSFFPWTPDSPDGTKGRFEGSYIPTSYYLELGEVLHKLLLSHNAYKDMGYEKLGQDCKATRLICHKCGYHSISQDFPRLVTLK